MRNNKLKQITTRHQADLIAAEHVQRYKEELFAKNASEILQQVMAAVLITLEKCYGWKGKRLTDFKDNFKMYLETMRKPDHFNSEWDNDENVQYVLDVFGIDLKAEFIAEVQKN